MFSFFKKEKIVLDCFTYIPAVYDNAKIKVSTSYFPEWWKTAPRILGNKNTIKSCRGFIDYFSQGFVVPSWFDADIHVYSKNDPEQRSFKVQYSNNYVDLSEHENTQFLDFAGQYGRNIKIRSPWAFRTKENINFLWTQPTWNMRSVLNKICVLPAVVNFKYQHHTHINFFLEQLDKEYTVNLPPISPLVMLHPMTEKKIEIKNHLVDEREYYRIFATEDLILNRNLQDESKEYERKKQIKDKIEKIERCPFRGNSNE